MNLITERQLAPLYRDERITLIHVGARRNKMNDEIWDFDSDRLLTLGFEPDEQSFRSLPQSPGRRYLPRALGQKQGTADFYLTRAGNNSSMLPPNHALIRRFRKTDAYDVVERTRVEVAALDDVLREENIGEADFIKLDTQGSELFILQGGEQTLAGSVWGVEVETEFVPLYEDQPLFPDVNRYLTERGFEMFDLRPVYWKREAGRRWGNPKGQLVYADALYLSGLERAVSIVGTAAEARRPVKVFKFIAVSALYGYVDYALVILEAFSKDFSARQRDQLSGVLCRCVSPARRWPDFRGRARIARLLCGMWQVFQPDRAKLVTRGRALGNWRFDGNMLET